MILMYHHVAPRSAAPATEPELLPKFRGFVPEGSGYPIQVSGLMEKRGRDPA